MSGAASSPPERGFPTIGPLTGLRGVGHARAARLERLGLKTVRDLLLLQPIRLVVWPVKTSIQAASRRKGERVTIEGRVRRSVLQRIGGKRSVVRATVSDGTGEMDLVFFNQPWMKEQLSSGTQVEAHGSVVEARGASIASPRLGTAASPLPAPGTLAPEYGGGDGVSSDALKAWIDEALERHVGEIEEHLPAEFLEHCDAPGLPVAVPMIHRPATIPDFEYARRRFALEPILTLQAAVFARRSGKAGRARAAKITAEQDAEIRSRYPFTLTDAQSRVIGEIRADLGRTRPMRRLLQGDVGAGKTAVAAYAAMTVAECGGQVAMMAPTEVLASQHAYGLRDLLEGHGLRTALITGSLRTGERRDVTQRLAAGEIDVVFGTHALFSEDVKFRRLDLAVIDEQHRFGVAQRGRLAGKGSDVHVLLMTATPIPRTLALTVYGDLEVSILDGSPPGRGSVRTRWARGDDRRRMPRFLAERLEAGEQIYWVVPRIGETMSDGDSEDAPASTAASAEARFENLVARPTFRQAGIELVHGRLPSVERNSRLDRFRRGDVATVVATTVVEVGVDVPNATIMVIEDAHRLGLAQLHQLRGRIGRGKKDSYCFLLGDKKAEERFRLMERSRDGFLLAEEDLRQRGMGDLLGLRQSGENQEGLVDPERDLDLLLAARDLFQREPGLLRYY
ncbi:ATP-dependent DNA helicase RecG [Planctomycetes bacterium Poly30]|uniref:ATP-dependent DNA helicase RecG n=1 Tax=Saltatorellus ferox TaxID=2528018 RepID=A0A518EWT7_9BACT|nr:ATP-dependent DNA helicase RecG [Planctomycetes bacterium Poly30]